MSGGSLSSISSSPSHSDISLDEEEVDSAALIVNNDYNTLVVENNLYLSRLIIHSGTCPQLDDICR